MTLYTTLEALTEPSREVDAEISLAVSWVAAYTSDLNAVIELIERELPGYGWRLTDGFHEFVEGILFPPDAFEPDIICKHKLPAVALLMAFFKARGEG